jgi:hypothetical protein
MSQVNVRRVIILGESSDSGAVLEEVIEMVLRMNEASPIYFCSS